MESLSIINTLKKTDSFFFSLYPTVLIIKVNSLAFVFICLSIALIALLIYLFILFKKQQNQNKANQKIIHRFKKEKLAYRNKETKHKILLETIPYGVIESDKNGNITYCNKLIHVILHHKENNIVGRKIWTIFTDSEKIKSFFQQILSLCPGEKVFYHTTKNAKGEDIHLKIDWNYRNNTEKEITGIIFIISDISKQKSAESSLKFERDLLQAMMDNIPFQIYFKDTKSRFIRINKMQAKVIGVKNPDEAIGKTDFDYFPHAKQAFEDEQKIIKTGQPIIDKIERIRTAEGHHRWVSATKIAIRNHHGQINGIVGISKDITESILAQQKLKMAKEKAEESDRLKSAFLANMSHEIRTPMNAIIGFTELLYEPHISLQSRREYLKYISNSGKTLLNLIDDIIDIAKIEAQQLKVKIESFKLHQILKELYAGYTEQLKSSGKDVEMKLVTDDKLKNKPIESDPYRLRQILNNLISNAIKFTSQGYIKFGYQIQEKKEMLHFFVEDTGIGMPREKLDIIFERFGQIEETYKKNKRGTGLGLAISKNLVNLLGGNMWVESELNKGSAFHFTLPMNFAKQKQKDKIAQKKQIPMENYNWEDKTILVAEDVAINYKLIEVALRKTKAKVLWAKNGIEAVEMVKENPQIDIILMDVQMPMMNGYDATREIKKLNKNLPIIAQTAFAMSGERESSLEAGCDSYITKPIKKNALMDTINEFIS